MNDFISAREAFYAFLYKKFTAPDGPYCSDVDFSELCKAKILMERARVFAADLGHIKQNRLGWYRLTAQGILYAEEIGVAQGGKHGD